VDAGAGRGIGACERNATGGFADTALGIGEGDDDQKASLCAYEQMRTCTIICWRMIVQRLRAPIRCLARLAGLVFPERQPVDKWLFASAIKSLIFCFT
jgi:hypothetical protein